MLQKHVSINKLRLARGYSYISMFAIPFLVAREIERIIPQIPWWILFILTAVGIWLVGLIDTEKGFLEAESEFAFQKNPEWMERNKRSQKFQNDS